MFRVEQVLRTAFRIAATLILASSLPSCGNKERELADALDRATQGGFKEFGWSVRRERDLEWMTQLGRGDSIAWQIVAARTGTLDVHLSFGPEARTEVAIPVARGRRVYVLCRPRLGESGLSSYRMGSASWDVSSERWGACLTVFTAYDAAGPEITTAGDELVEWNIPRGNFPTFQRPYFHGEFAGTEVEGIPMGPLAIPAAARVTGLSGVHRMGDPADPAQSTTALVSGMIVPDAPSREVVLAQVTWSTRSDDDASPVEVGTWTISASLRTHADHATGDR